MNNSLINGYAVLCTSNNCVYSMCKSKSAAYKFFLRRRMEGSGNNWEVWKFENRVLTEKIY